MDFYYDENPSCMSISTEHYRGLFVFSYYYSCYAILKSPFNSTFPLRIELENGLYHLTSRGIEKRNNLSRFMHNLNTSYAVYFNKRYKRVGSLFQGRYKAILVDKDSYLLELVRYIHLNPVRAGIVSYPEDYIWSSYQEYTGERKNVMIMTDWVSGYFGVNWREDFIRFTQGDVRKKNPFNNLKASLILGSNKFVEKIKKKLPEIERNETLPSYKKLTALTVNSESGISKLFSR